MELKFGSRRKEENNMEDYSRMNKEEALYFVYRHIRLDIFQVFYIGFGTSNLESRKETMFFRRAYEKGKRERSNFWHRIAKKAGFEVEIIFTSSNKEEAEAKEREFIKIYGKYCDGKGGTLTNFLDGGSSKPEERKQRINPPKSDPRKNFIHAYYAATGIYVGEFESQTEAGRRLSVSPKKISCMMNNRPEYKTINGYVFYREYKGEKIEPVPIGHENKFRAIVALDEEGSYINTFESAVAAAKEFNVFPSRIWKCLKYGRILDNKFTFQYEDVYKLNN